MPENNLGFKEFKKKNEKCSATALAAREWKHQKSGNDLWPSAICTKLDLNVDTGAL